MSTKFRVHGVYSLLSAMDRLVSRARRTPARQARMSCASTLETPLRTAACTVALTMGISILESRVAFVTSSYWSTGSTLETKAIVPASKIACGDPRWQTTQVTRSRVDKKRGPRHFVRSFLPWTTTFFVQVQASYADLQISERPHPRPLCKGFSHTRERKATAQNVL